MSSSLHALRGGPHSRQLSITAQDNLSTVANLAVAVSAAATGQFDPFDRAGGERGIQGAGDLYGRNVAGFRQLRDAEKSFGVGFFEAQPALTENGRCQPLQRGRRGTRSA